MPRVAGCACTSTLQVSPGDTTLAQFPPAVVKVAWSGPSMVTLSTTTGDVLVLVNDMCCTTGSGGSTGTVRKLPVIVPIGPLRAGTTFHATVACTRASSPAEN